MLLTYVGRLGSVIQPVGAGRSAVVERGGTAEVPKDLAAKLLNEQPAEWKAADAPARSKKRSAETKPEEGDR